MDFDGYRFFSHELGALFLALVGATVYQKLLRLLRAKFLGDCRPPNGTWPACEQEDRWCQESVLSSP